MLWILVLRHILHRNCADRLRSDLCYPKLSTKAERHQQPNVPRGLNVQPLLNFSNSSCSFRRASSSRCSTACLSRAASIVSRQSLRPSVPGRKPSSRHRFSSARLCAATISAQPVCVKAKSAMSGDALFIRFLEKFLILFGPATFWCRYGKN